MPVSNIRIDDIKAVYDDCLSVLSRLKTDEYDAWIKGFRDRLGQSDEEDVSEIIIESMLVSLQDIIERLYPSLTVEPYYYLRYLEIEGIKYTEYNFEEV